MCKYVCVTDFFWSLCLAIFLFLYGSVFHCVFLFGGLWLCLYVVLFLSVVVSARMSVSACLCSVCLCGIFIYINKGLTGLG